MEKEYKHYKNTVIAAWKVSLWVGFGYVIKPHDY